MSNATYPVLPGLAWPVRRTPVWKTNVQTTPSGREFRTSPMLLPRHRYSLQYEFLRSGAAFQEFETLFGFYNAHGGSFDSFLFNDADDNTVTAQPFGTGDGVTTVYPLVRTLGGFAEPVGATTGAPVVSINGQPANLVANSSFEARSAGQQPYGFDAYNNGSIATAFISAGGRTGGLSFALRADAASSQAFGLHGDGYNTAGGVTGGVRGGWRANATYVVSFYAKGTGSAWRYLRQAWNVAPANTVALASPLLSTSWQRYEFQITMGATVEQVGGLYLYVADAASNVAATSSGDTLYIDDLQVVLAGAAVPYVAGEQGYTINANAQITFDAPQPVGAALTWSGSYRWRCRFDTDDLSFDQFLHQFWRTGDVRLITVKP